MNQAILKNVRAGFGRRQYRPFSLIDTIFHGSSHDTRHFLMRVAAMAFVAYALLMMMLICYGLMPMRGRRRLAVAPRDMAAIQARDMLQQRRCRAPCLVLVPCYKARPRLFSSQQGAGHAAVRHNYEIPFHKRRPRYFCSALLPAASF